MKKHIKTGALVLTALLIFCVGIYGISLAGVSGSVTSLSVFPDPVKLGSTATIQYSLSSAGPVSIKVLNGSGDVVKTLLDNVNKNAGTWVQAWNGAYDNGAIVPDGSYTFVVEQKDAGGNVIGSGDITKTAAVVPGITAYAASPATFNPAAGEKASINYTLSANALVTVTILNGYTPVKTICSGMAQNAGANSVEWDGTDSSGTRLVGDASYTFQIDAVSPTVANFKSTQKGTVTVEKEAPQVTGFSASPNPLKLGSNNLTISYTLSEASRVTLKVYDSSNVAKRTILNAVSKNAGSAVVSWDGKDDARVLVPEGSYTIVLNAVDNSGKSSGDKTVTVTAGCVPAITDAAANPGNFNPNMGSTTIGYSLSNRAIVTVQILNGFTPVKTLTSNATLEAGAQSVVWDGTDSLSKVVSDGSYTFQITAKSTLVSTFSSIYKGTVIVDKGTISISGLAASPNPLKLGVNNLSISYTLSDAATVYASIYNGPDLVRNLAAGVAKNAGYVSHSWDGRDGSGNLVNEGNYTVTVCAVGLSGKAVDASLPFAAGVVPAVTALSSSPEPYDPGSGDATFKFTLSDPANVKITISQGYITVRTLSQGLMPAGENTVTWDGKDSSTTPKPVGDGTYTYKVEATSPAVSSFTGSSSGTMTVSGASPQVTSLSVSPVIVKIGTPATLRYTVSEPATIKAQIVDANGDTVKTFPDESKAAGSYSISWDTRSDTGAAVTPGGYTLKVTATDAANLEGTGQLGFQAGMVPTISGAATNPPSIDLSAGERSTTISYSVDVESYVTVKALDAYGAVWKNLTINKRVYGADSVVLDVYNDGTPMTGTLGYTIEASSVIGYFKALPVSGTFLVGGQASGEINCTDCHTSYPRIHPMTNCFGCHGNDEPIENCAACHQGVSHSDGSVLVRFQCIFCHNDKYPDKIPAGHGDIAPIHDTTLGSDCQNCHNQNLSVEHPLHQDDYGVAYDCSTCHSDTASQIVRDAVDAGNKDCAACHGANPGDHEQYHAPTGIEAGCTNCHKDSLTQEHLNNPTTQTGNSWDCDTCHGADARQEVKDAISTGDKTCGACHSAANHQVVHQTNNLDDKCTTCHNNNLVDEHLTNAETQTDPNDPTKLKGWTCDTCHASTKPEVVGAIATNNVQCAACHRSGHGLGFTENVLADIPLYQNAADPAYPDGYIWSPPQDAFIWAGESWMPDEYIVGGKLVMSSRRTGIVAQDVYNYYFDALTSKGWVGTSAAPSFADNFFDVNFTKDLHKAKIMFYGGAYHNAAPVVAGGYRIEILYK